MKIHSKKRIVEHHTARVRVMAKDLKSARQAWQFEEPPGSSHGPDNFVPGELATQVLRKLYPDGQNFVADDPHWIPPGDNWIVQVKFEVEIGVVKGEQEIEPDLEFGEGGEGAGQVKLRAKKIILERYIIDTWLPLDDMPSIGALAEIKMQITRELEKSGLTGGRLSILRKKEGWGEGRNKGISGIDVRATYTRALGETEKKEL